MNHHAIEMSKTDANAKRLELIGKLGELVPVLQGRVHQDEFLHISGIHQGLKLNPSDLEPIDIDLRTYLASLRYFTRTDEFYLKNTESKQLLETVASILERIVSTYGE